jgi:hypothetical protein
MAAPRSLHLLLEPSFSGRQPVMVVTALIEASTDLPERRISHAGNLDREGRTGHGGNTPIPPAAHPVEVLMSHGMQ